MSMTNVNNTTHCVDFRMWETLRVILWWFYLVTVSALCSILLLDMKEQGKVENGVESVQPSDETQVEKDITKSENVDLPRRSVVKSPVQQHQHLISIFCMELQTEWNRRLQIRKGGMVTRRLTANMENPQLSELEKVFQKFWEIGNLSEV